MKRVLIISPYFAPFNTADSQRIRMSLAYFKDFDWEAEVVCVDEKYTDLRKDPLLLQSIPADCIIHKVTAFSKKITSKFGLGSLALRSLWFYNKAVKLLLQAKKYDLIYFSTTEFPVCILGRYWKKRFGIPYLIDMQDAWHSDYYQNKSKNQRPKKYWFSYNLHRLLEPFAMKTCDGIISVSQAYVDVLQLRYTQLKQKPTAVIPFGAFEEDFKIAQKNYTACLPALQPEPGKVQIVYIGRGGTDMQHATGLIFEVLKEALQENTEAFGCLHFYFIGTSYVPKDQAAETIMPVAAEFGVQNHVTEITDRLPYYRTINTLLAADALLIIGSDDPEYTASKIYPYLLAEKPLLAVFHQNSSAVNVIEQCSPESIVATFPDHHLSEKQKIRLALNQWANFSTTKNPVERKLFEEFTAKQMTRKQVTIFEGITGR